MNFSQLKYIIAVDKHRNFARAAEECDVAQSTLSKEIQRLEKEFDIMLFDRSRHPVTPTMKGLDLIHQAKIIIEEQHSFIDTAQKKSNRPAGDFRLAILPMLAPYLLPLFIQSLAKKYPELNIAILELTPQEMVTHFEGNELDGAITVAPFIKEGFYADTLFEEDFVLYVGADHPLSKKDKVSWSDIPPEELILHEGFNSYMHISEDIENSTDLSLKSLGNINYQGGSLETIRKIIDRNGGLTLLPKLSCIYMGERRRKMVRPIINPILNRTIALVTSRGFEKNRMTKVIKEEIVRGLARK